MQGVCPECGCCDSLYLVLPTPILPVALESMEANGTGGTKAIIYPESLTDELAPAEKFHCQNCGAFFNTPRFAP